MSTLKDIFAMGRNGFCPLPINVKICGATTQLPFEKNGEAEKYVILGIADCTMAGKCLLFDMSRCDDLKEGRFVMLQNTFIKLEPENVVQISPESIVLTIGNFYVPFEIEKEAREFAISPEISVKDVETLPLKKMVSIRAHIYKVGNFKKVAAMKTNKTITLKDGNDECDVTLWEPFDDMEMYVGQLIYIKDVVVNPFNDKKVLGTTIRTTFEIMEASTW